MDLADTVTLIAQLALSGLFIFSSLIAAGHKTAGTHYFGLCNLNDVGINIEYQKS